MKTMVLQRLSGPEVFRLSDETHISRVHLRTPDLPRALDFYQRVIGFKVVENAKGEASLSATGSPPGFLAFTEDQHAAPRRPRTTGLYHFAIRYPTRRDLANALRRIMAEEYPVTGASDHTLGNSIHVGDPDGNGVELYFDVPRSQWPMRNGRLIRTGMGPLDFESLLRTVADSPLPAHAAPETDIGHINLHVADLEEAEQFFHEFFGFDVMAHIGPDATFLSAGGYHHHVAVNTWAGKAPALENAAGLISYRFEVPDGRVLAELKERAGRFGYQARMAGEILQIRDPNGRWLEVELTERSKPVGYQTKRALGIPYALPR